VSMAPAQATLSFGMHSMPYRLQTEIPVETYSAVPYSTGASSSSTLISTLRKYISAASISSKILPLVNGL